MYVWIAPDVVEPLEVLLHRAGCRPSRRPARGNAPGARPRRRSASTTCTTSAPSSSRGTSPGTRWTPSSTIDHPSVSARCNAASTPTHTCRRLLDETDDGRVARDLLVERLPRLEARVVDRRHELGEKKARIVCRMKSVDVTRVMPSRWATSAATVDLPVPVAPPISTTIGTSSSWSSDSRRSRPTARSPSVSPSTSRASSSSRSRSTPRLARPRRGRARCVAPAGTPGRPARRPRSAHAPSAPSNTAARRRRAGAARTCAAAVITTATAGTSPSSAPSSRQRATTSFAASTTRIAALERVFGDDVDRRGLDLDEIGVGVDQELARSARAVGERRRDVNDVGVEMRDVRRAGGEHRDPSSSGSERRSRSVARTAPRRRSRPSTTTSEISRRYGVEVRSRGRCAPDDEHATRGRDRRDRRPAPVEQRRRRARAPRPAARRRRRSRRRRAPASPPPARRQPIVGTPVSAAVSRWSEAAWRPARESATRSSTVGGVSTSSGSGGPPRPIATTTTSPVAREQAREVAGDGGLPDPLPGADDRERRQLERLERRRVEAEVRADVRQAGGERARAPSRTARAGPSTGSSERSTTTSGVAEAVERAADAVVRSVAQLLRAADEDRPHPLVRQRRSASRTTGRVVLSVDQRDALSPSAPSPRSRSGPCTSRTRRSRRRTG